MYLLLKEMEDTVAELKPSSISNDSRAAKTFWYNYYSSFLIIGYNINSSRKLERARYFKLILDIASYLGYRISIVVMRHSHERGDTLRFLQCDHANQTITQIYLMLLQEDHYRLKRLKTSSFNFIL